MESAEASGKSIEDAILQALARLGRNRNEVDITVLQEPSRGTRGMGAREARVRVYLKPSRAARPAPGVVTPDMARDLLEVDEDEEAEPLAGNGDEYAAEEAFEEFEEEDDLEPILTAPLKEVVAEDASIEEIAIAALRVVLAHMGVRASVEAAEVESDDEEEPVTLNIHSDDQDTISLLIGRRGETLAALQLIVSLIVSKQTGNRERIIVDAESYRVRREQNLRAMAQRVAAQVRHSGHPITLEAMPPNERRIIHMELQETGDISTESTGEGDQRRVVVSLKG
ncbi:MAG: RNA-binding cell elongation regulator Jag/EloR [Ktedonobacterales bacterium]